MLPSKLIIRNYREEDLPGILALYSSISDKSPHFVRNEHFLRYFIHCYGVSEDSIFVAVKNRKIVGLAIVSINEMAGLRQGDILELHAKDALFLGSLVQTAVNYCKSKDLDMVIVVPPAHLHTNKVFSNWQKFETGIMMCKSLSVLSLMQVLLDNEEIKSHYSGKRIVFQVDDELIEIKITFKEIDVSKIDNKHRRPGIKIDMSLQTFLKIVFGQVNPYLAYFNRKLQIRGIRNVRAVLKLFQIVKLKKSWPTALVDRV